MTVIPFVHEGLGNSSYLVGLAGGEALLVDPDRSAQRYVEAAHERGWTIVGVFETHLHADFVTGARELVATAGAAHFAPAKGGLAYPHRPVGAGEHVRLGEAVVEVVASPGHTPEHLAYVIRLAGQAPQLFSGGSLIVGGAARTDLVSAGMTERLTRDQYHTIREAFAGLPDDTVLFPTHGGGSFCSTGAGGERTSTLGQERRTNPLLADQSEDEFAEWFPTSFPAAPAYFARMRGVNQAGPRLRAEVPRPPALPPGEFNARRPGRVLVDTRPQAAFMAGHVPGALSIGFRDAFATWLGWLVKADADILFVKGDEPLERLLDEALLVGYERFSGLLASGMAAWMDAGLPVSTAGLATAREAAVALKEGGQALDVREPDEFRAGHLPDAIHIPLGRLPDELARLARDRPIVTYCGHGERSATALSLLEASGFETLINLDGGMGAWEAAELPVEHEPIR